MPRFRYTAKRSPQEVIEGVVEADNRSGVLAYLAQAGYVPIRVSEHAQDVARASQAPPSAPSRLRRARRLPASQLTSFTRQFASLTRSAVPLLRSLQILERQARHPTLRVVLHEVAEAVRQGQTLSSALAKFPQAFPLLYVNLVRSGEMSGALDAVLDRLAAQQEQEEAMRMRVRMALTYPAFVGVVGCLTVVFLMVFVMPRLSRLLTGLGDRLPAPTRLLLALGEWMSQWWFWGLLLGGAVAIALLWNGLGDRGRLAVDRAILRLPFLGQLITQVELARAARSLGLQLSHGIPILQAIEVAIHVVGHRVIRAEMLRLPEGLRQGGALSTGLKGLSIGTPFLINTVAVGEESGRVGEALTEVASYYERESERLLQAMAALLEPVLIILVGLVVGFIVMAVLLPIFEMSAI